MNQKNYARIFTLCSVLVIFNMLAVKLNAQTNQTNKTTSENVTFSENGTTLGKGSLSGKVLDETKKAFPYATVSLLNAKDSTVVKGTLSADNGSFIFNGINTGNYLLAFYVVGYKKLYKGPYQIGQEVKTVGEVQLSTDTHLLQGVEIVKQKPLIERQIDKTVINVENSALAAGG